MKQERDKKGIVNDKELLKSYQKNRLNSLRYFRNNIDAVRFLETIGYIVQVWDDLIDKDKELNDETINRTFWMAIIELQDNPFFHQYHKDLIPIIRDGANAWLDANEFERGCSTHEKRLAFVLRSMIYNLRFHCAYLIGGYDWLRSISKEMRLDIYNETEESYSKFLDEIEKERTIRDENIHRSSN